MSADAPAGLVGVHDMAFTQGIDQQFESRFGELREALFGADECGGANLELAIGQQEIADFPVADAKAVLHLSGHGEHDGAQCVAGSADGVGRLFGVMGLAVFTAAPAVASAKIELGYDRHDRRQVSLELHHLATVVERLLATGGVGQRHVDNAVDLVGRWLGSEIDRVALAASGLLGLVGIGFVAAERVGLAPAIALALLEFLTQALNFGFKFGDASVTL
jgi:hypothetical protein